MVDGFVYGYCTAQDSVEMMTVMMMTTGDGDGVDGDIDGDNGGDGFDDGVGANEDKFGQLELAMDQMIAMILAMAAISKKIVMTVIMNMLHSSSSCHCDASRY